MMMKASATARRVPQMKIGLLSILGHFGLPLRNKMITKHKVVCLFVKRSPNVDCSMDHFLDNVNSVENKFKVDRIVNGATSDRVVKLVERDQHICKPVF